jgi:hypothetical protein
MIALKGKGIATEPFTTGVECTAVLTKALLCLKGLRQPQHHDEK